MYIKINVTRMPDIPLDIKPPYAQKNNCKPYHEPIDVVISWVNGTDPKFLAQLNANEPEKAAETEASRFRDMNQLKYAIRSFQKYAPWVRDIILLTNGQGIMLSILPCSQLLFEPLDIFTWISLLTLCESYFMKQRKFKAWKSSRLA